MEQKQVAAAAPAPAVGLSKNNKSPPPHSGWKLKKWRDPIIIFQVIALPRNFLFLSLSLSKNICWEGLNVCMNYEFNLFAACWCISQKASCGGVGAGRTKGMTIPQGPNWTRG